MKRLMLVLPIFALLVLATTAPADIKGTAHDFSGAGWSQGEVCKPCHTPHNAIIGDNYPKVNHILWNHTITTAQFSMFDGTTGPITTLSKLCLSCHDGTVALDSYGGATGSSFINPGKRIGTDLRDNHPVAVEYTESWHAKPSELQFARLFSYNTKLYIECSSCHAAHGAHNGAPKLLRVSNTGSALCFDCHRTR